MKSKAFQKKSFTLYSNILLEKGLLKHFQVENMHSKLLTNSKTILKHLISYIMCQEITYSDLVLPGISAAVYSSLLPGWPPNRVPDASPESTPPSSGRSGRAHCSRDTPPSPICRTIFVHHSRQAWYIHSVSFFFSKKRLFKQLDG